MFSYEKYEIRLESIGGLGANLVGKLLGQLGAEYMELNAQSFASYGSEKRGSPVKAYIRYSNPDKEIRINCPVEKPDLLGIFNISLGGEENVTAGVDENTNIVVNTVLSPEETRYRCLRYVIKNWHKSKYGTFRCYCKGKWLYSFGKSSTAGYRYFG